MIIFILSRAIPFILPVSRSHVTKCRKRSWDSSHALVRLPSSGRPMILFWIQSRSRCCKRSVNCTKSPTREISFVVDPRARTSGSSTVMRFPIETLRDPLNNDDSSFLNYDLCYCITRPLDAILDLQLRKPLPNNRNN